MKDVSKALADGMAKTFDIGNMSAEVASEYIRFKYFETCMQSLVVVIGVPLLFLLIYIFIKKFE